MRRFVLTVLLLMLPGLMVPAGAGMRLCFCPALCSDAIGCCAPEDGAAAQPPSAAAGVGSCCAPPSARADRAPPARGLAQASAQIGATCGHCVRIVAPDAGPVAPSGGAATKLPASGDTGLPPTDPSALVPRMQAQACPVPAAALASARAAPFLPLRI